MAKPRTLRQLRLPLGVNKLPSTALRELLKTSAYQPRKSKYGAIRTVAENRTFDSKREATRYLELRLLEDAGAIRNLECQKRFPLMVKGIPITTYVADFVYVFASTGETVVEDSKGFRTASYRLKKRLFEAIHGFRILET